MLLPVSQTLFYKGKSFRHMTEIPSGCNKWPKAEPMSPAFTYHYWRDRMLTGHPGGSASQRKFWAHIPHMCQLKSTKEFASFKFSSHHPPSGEVIKHRTFENWNIILNSSQLCFGLYQLFSLCHNPEEMSYCNSCKVNGINSLDKHKSKTGDLDATCNNKSWRRRIIFFFFLFLT